MKCGVGVYGTRVEFFSLVETIFSADTRASDITVSMNAKAFSEKNSEFPLKLGGTQSLSPPIWVTPVKEFFVFVQ